MHDLGLEGEHGISRQLEIPILPDMHGTTPLDICLAINTHRKADKIVFIQHTDSDIMDEIKATENEAMAEVIFKNIKEYGFMHSSQLINESIIQATKLQLPSLGDYLESRLKQVSHCFQSNTQH